MSDEHQNLNAEYAEAYENEHSTRFMYRKEEDGHKTLMHVASVHVWRELSSTRLEECTTPRPSPWVNPNLSV